MECSRREGEGEGGWEEGEGEGGWEEGEGGWGEGEGGWEEGEGEGGCDEGEGEGGWEEEDKEERGRVASVCKGMRTKLKAYKLTSSKLGITSCLAHKSQLMAY